jgi:hypothetical protein
LTFSDLKIHWHPTLESKFFYYEEFRQHLEFLKEQAHPYACCVASTHLTSIRLCQLVIAKKSWSDAFDCGCLGS